MDLEEPQKNSDQLIKVVDQVTNYTILTLAPFLV